MKPIQLLIDEKLVRRLDQEAKRLRSNRSKLIRRAVEQFLRDQERLALEEADRSGYRRRPPRVRELDAWEAIQAWPED
jgi:metal-responsive CopG/Arc/MetJ family transcriptional regulator